MSTEAISAAPGKWYAINAKAAEDEAEILIYDVIGAYGINAKQFVQDLEAIEAKTINVRINSEGGEVFDATAIYNALKTHPARIVTHVDGVAASAGSFIALSGDEVRMADNSYMMIHEARGGVMGEADEMRTYAGILDKINDTLAAIYQKKAGKTRKYWRDKMADETWFTAAEARTEGLADKVFEAAKKQEAKAHAAFDFTIYNQAKIPEPVKAMWGITEKVQPAPELSSRDEPPQALTTESQPMADTSTNPAPVQTPVAASPGTNPQQVEDPKQKEIAQLDARTEKGWIEQGREVGFEQGRKAEMKRFEEIVAACPNRPAMAINAFRAGQSAEAVKLAHEQRLEAESAAREAQAAQEMEIRRLKAQIATGGYPGGVEMGISDDTDMPEMDPKLQAEREWENKPSVRKGFRSKANYVSYRENQLKGRVAEPAKAN